MEEIEAKLLDVDYEDARERIEDTGATRVYEGRVQSRFYDFPDGRIEDEGVCRLRTMGDQSFVTLKKDRSREGAKEMEEIEFAVDDAETAAYFLEGLGMQQVRESSKHRTKWKRDGLEYVIDEYPGIPPLLEIEAPDRERLDEAFDELGYDPEETVSWDAGEVFDHYGD